MDPDQEHDPARWFGESEVDDPDSPSDRSVDTAVRDGRCVFLNGAGRCVLQTASLGDDRPPVDLKPFVCTGFPLVVLNGLLTIEDEFPNHPRCCSPAPDGKLTALDVFGSELRYVLGEPGVDELRRLMLALERDEFLGLLRTAPELRARVEEVAEIRRAAQASCR